MLHRMMSKPSSVSCTSIMETSTVILSIDSYTHVANPNEFSESRIERMINDAVWPRRNQIFSQIKSEK